MSGDLWEAGDVTPWTTIPRALLWPLETLIKLEVPERPGSLVHSPERNGLFLIKSGY